MKRSALALALSLAATAPLLTPSTASAQSGDPLSGWEVLGPNFSASDPLDFAAYEWEYFTIQNEDESFLGVVGYVVADPRGSGTEGIALVPAGGNMAVAAWEPGRSASAQFITFGLDNTDASATEKYLLSQDPSTGNFGLLEPAPGATSADPALVLRGQSDDYQWDLVVEPDFLEYLPLRNAPDAAFSAVRGDDVGLLAGENWTIDAVWPRTRVTGTFTERATGRVIPINAKGYRENSFGNYLLSVDGWDFAVFSDTDARVQMMLQTYHRSDTIDYFDISFPDGGVPKNVRFRTTRDELGWYHPNWTFDSRAKQCVPETTWFVADNGEYRVEVVVDADAGATVPYAPFLDDSTLGTSIFFIMEQFPQLNGVIRRSGTGEIVTTFSGRGGGEFAWRKSLFNSRSDFACWLNWSGKFSSPFPH